jgi:hypothetical protein
LNDWSLRNISLLGKITVIKTLALPILVQCFTVLPHPPDHIIKSLQNIFYTFIWNGKTDKIKRSTLICDYSNGGLKMPHIQSFIHALKVSWIKKIVDPMNQGPWKVPISDHFTYLSQTFSNLLFTAITSLNFMGIAFSKPLY